MVCQGLHKAARKKKEEEEEIYIPELETLFENFGFTICPLK